MGVPQRWDPSRLLIDMGIASRHDRMATRRWPCRSGQTLVERKRLSQLLLCRKACGSTVCREERETTRRITEYLEVLLREGGLALKAIV